MKKKWISSLLIFTLLFGAVGFAGLPVQAAVQEDVLFDDLEDFLILDSEKSTTDNLGFATTAQVNLTDTTRIYKLSDADDLDANTYITYDAEYAITGFTVIAAIHKTKDSGLYAGEFRLAVSEDGEFFTDLTMEEDYTLTIPNSGDKEDGTSQWGNDAWREATIQSVEGALPENSRFLRIYFPPTVSLSVSNSSSFTQLSSVSIEREYPAINKLGNRIADVQAVLDNARIGNGPGMYPYEAAAALDAALAQAKALHTDPGDAEDAELLAAVDTLEQAVTTFENTAVALPQPNWKDECNDLSKVAASFGIGYKAPGDFKGIGDSDDAGNDDFAFSRATGSERTGNYVIYEVPDGMTVYNLRVETAYLLAAADAKDMIIKAAPASVSGTYEDAEFTEVTWTKERFGDIAGKWDRYRYTVSLLPEETKYIRVELGDTGGTAHAIQVTKVEWAQVENSSGDYRVTQKYAGDQAKFEVTYIGASEAAQPVWLVTAVYQDGSLADISLVSAQCSKNVTETLMTEIIPSSDGTDVKVLLWDGTVLSPLVEAVEGF